MSRGTLAHSFDPALVVAHLRRPAVWATRESDYLFELPDVDQSALDAAIAAALAGEPIPVVVPEQVYGHQMRAILRARPFGGGSLWDKVLQLVAQLPEPHRTTVDDSLRTAAVMQRSSPAITQFQAVLQLPPEYVDQLFIDADQVRV